MSEMFKSDKLIRYDFVISSNLRLRRKRIYNKLHIYDIFVYVIDLPFFLFLLALVIAKYTCTCFSIQSLEDM